jgi:hypothetical protein
VGAKQNADTAALLIEEENDDETSIERANTVRVVHQRKTTKDDDRVQL